MKARRVHQGATVLVWAMYQIYQFTGMTRLVRPHFGHPGGWNWPGRLGCPGQWTGFAWV